jgi:hypothetical protein
VVVLLGEVVVLGAATVDPLVDGVVAGGVVDDDCGADVSRRSM